MNDATKQIIAYCKKRIRESGVKGGYYTKIIKTLKMK